MGGDKAVIVAGIGCRRACIAADLVALVRDAADRAGVRIDRLAAPADKCSEPGLRDAAAQLGLTMIAVAPADLLAVQPRCVTRSARVQAAVGVASVAEAAALVAVGESGRLLLARIASATATCALATT